MSRIIDAYTKYVDNFVKAMASSLINPSTVQGKSAAELREMAAALIKHAEEISRREFESTINFLNEKLAKMGKTKKDAVVALCMLMKPSELVDTVETITGEPSTKQRLSASDVDSTGERPEPGVSYRLPSGETWTKQRTGASKKEFVAHAQTGSWKAMKV